MAVAQTKPTAPSAEGLLPVADLAANDTSSREFDKEQELVALRQMLLIRRFEEKAGQMYGMGLIGGFCHLYIGQEAVVVGMKLAMRDGDQMITGAPPTSLHLEPKASAYFAFNKIACVTFADRYAQTLRVMLPSSPVSRSIQLRPHDRLIDYCHGSDTFRTVTVSAVVPIRAEAFCRLQGSCGR